MPDVLMPKLSDTMEEGRIIRWLKQRGDRIAIGDILAEVETDKANMELEAFDEGTLAEIRTPEGESAPVGAVIAVLSEGGVAAEAPPAATTEQGAPKPAAAPAPEAREKPAAKAPVPPPEAEARAAEPAPETREAKPAPQADPEPEEAGSRVRASPLARRIARDRGVALDSVAGTGPGGRIVERDVEQASASAPKRPAAADAPSRPRPVAAVARPAAAAAPSRRVELGKMRRTTAKRMAEAKRDIPHFYASSDVAMDECVRLKEGLGELEGEYTGLTYTHLVLKAVGVALRRVPEMNASLDDESVVLHDTVHVGLATATDQGLVVPVVRDCDRQPLGALVAQVRGLVERARAGKFAADDLRGGTFTVSNLGMYPVSHFAAVVNPPQAAILAVGTVRAVPVVRNGEVVPGHQMTVTLSCDHRIVDGALAGGFLRELVRLLEAPLALVA
jgi:pyruvate dehydrogenase E2 component (dihydrolipoyllysine-residue acetyltransferase)